MGFNFDNSGIASRYRCARALRPDVLGQWLDAIRNGVGGVGIDSVLDLGCGTGRFSGGLQRAFSCDVIGVEPAQKMIAQAAREPRVHYVVGRAEAIPLAGDAIDLTFLSMVWHHLADKRRAGREIHRVVKPDRFLCVRTSTIELLDHYLYLQFFPSARAINERTLPARAQLTQWAAASGFQLIQQREIRQAIDPSIIEYARRIEQRGLSDLARISDAEFERGAQALRTHAQNVSESIAPIIEPVDLFVFVRD
jgi:ubiquinone/menaquinone biosynthesis C-methylase UbiE